MRARFDSRLVVSHETSVRIRSKPTSWGATAGGGLDRKSVGEGKRGDLGGRRIIKKKKKKQQKEEARKTTNSHNVKHHRTTRLAPTDRRNKENTQTTTTHTTMATRDAHRT